MSDPKGWTADRVRQHLQNAVYLEMWTVPLYLTAAYSIAAPVDPQTSRPELAPVPAKPDGTPDFSRFTQQDYNQYAFNSILSVAIQEMLHVELAANILNAVRPQAAADPKNPWVKFSGPWAPSYAAAPPVLDASLPPGVVLELGPLDANQARLFQWIEEEREETDPEQYRPQYTSIGAFYTSLQYGAQVCWPDLYPPAGLGPEPTAAQLLQKDDWSATAKFAARSGFLNFFFFGVSMASAASPGALANALAAKSGSYPFSIEIHGSAKDAQIRAQAAMTAIKVQGEGAGSGEVPPIFVPDSGNPIEIALDRISHWERFTELLTLVQQGRIQLLQAPPDTALPGLQMALDQSYSAFLVSLDQAYASTAAVGIEAMRGLGNRTLQVWQHGGTPEYRWSDPSAAYDPTHSRDLHACQGLNMCAGKGLNGTGTKAGDGDCATAWFHTCSTTNTCAGQGGCGYPGDPANPQNDWSPNYNSAQGNGGCGAPIPSLQVFSKDAPDDLKYKDVWAYARQLMRNKVPGFPTGDPPPNELRTLLTPTSAKTGS